MRRTCVVELVVDEETERGLRQLYDLSLKLWNEVNYVRLRMWLEKKFIGFEETYKEFYEKYKPLIGAITVQTIIRSTQYTDDTSNPRAPKRGRGNGRRPGQGLNPQKEGM
jgi:hypothetical protein